MATVVAGNGIAGFSGDNGAAINAALYFPRAVIVDSSGNLYISAKVTNVYVRSVVQAQSRRLLELELLVSRAMEALRV
jgi:hypothetical protein